MKIAPYTIRVVLEPMLTDISYWELEYLMRLDNHWVNLDGVVHHETEIPGRPPQFPNMQEFRYRSRPTEVSKFPADVQLGYVNPTDGSFPPKLDEIQITRAYKFLTPEQCRAARK